MIRVYCKNTGTSRDFTEGVTLQEVLSDFQFDQPYRIVSAKVNNVSQGLRYKLYNSRDVEFLDVRDARGMLVYCRSLCFLLYKACCEALPGSKLYIEHPISNGFYCNLFLADDTHASVSDIDMVREKMEELVREDVKFHRREVSIDKAIQIFKEDGQDDKVKLLETSEEVYTDYYLLGDTPDYYYARLVPSTGFLYKWGLEPYHEGRQCTTLTSSLRSPTSPRPSPCSTRTSSGTSSWGSATSGTSTTPARAARPASSYRSLRPFRKRRSCR